MEMLGEELHTDETTVGGFGPCITLDFPMFKKFSSLFYRKVITHRLGKDRVLEESVDMSAKGVIGFIPGKTLWLAYTSQ